MVLWPPFDHSLEVRTHLQDHPQEVPGPHGDGKSESVSLREIGALPPVHLHGYITSQMGLLERLRKVRAGPAAWNTTAYLVLRIR